MGVVSRYKQGVHVTEKQRPLHGSITRLSMHFTLNFEVILTVGLLYAKGSGTPAGHEKKNVSSQVGYVLLSYDL